MPATPLSGNTARAVPPLAIAKSTGAGCERLIWRWILRRSAVALCVVNTLSAATPCWRARDECMPSRSDLP